jgi:hypothetical protein
VIEDRPKSAQRRAQDVQVIYGQFLSIPPALRAQFEECLRNKAIPKKTHGSYKKWLRYYPDFCNKYDLLDAQRESLPPFLKNLSLTGGRCCL